jgi:hypothetical protein
MKTCGDPLMDLGLEWCNIVGPLRKSFGNWCWGRLEGILLRNRKTSWGMGVVIVQKTTLKA